MDTPVRQPLDKVVNILFKGYICEIYDLWALTSPINTETGVPHPTTWQQCATWVVEAWEKVLEEVCVKAWSACAYKTNKEFESDQVTAIYAYTDEQVSWLVKD